MRILICHLLVLAVLYMGVEGAWDMAKESHAHNDSTAHQFDVDKPAPTADPEPLSDGDTAHCGHLCHGHSASIIGLLDDSLNLESSHYRQLDSNLLADFTRAPPSPPPNV